MPDDKVVYRGWMKKGEQPNTIVAEITDSWGWVIKLAGVLDPDTKTYRIEGTLGETPEALRLPWLDGPNENTE